ncbi:MAG: GIY-YIG nuclease family protein [Candidatus Pacebacteria bacterium]|nr:GIY-YIG nuclease family protein [Candidatus Paceibacterota bacterium]
MYYVYILKNNKNQTYIGQTKNLDDRLERHNSGREKYTKNKGVFEIIYKESYNTRSQAILREKMLKGGKGREWIKNTILKQYINN